MAKRPYYRNDKFKYIEGVYSIDDPYLYEAFRLSPSNMPIQMLLKRKNAENITIYGRSLNAFCFISGLINRNVKPVRIFYVIPPSTLQKKKIFETNKEMFDFYDDYLFDADPFEDESVLDKELQILKQLGVTVFNDF